ncbi:MAG TPA: transcription termination factor Rho [Acidimicrobiales bacterium]|nr:transcription termination factor Rho [Acidimicrobiales bacterium]
MAGEQLERSILERKERDELHAIASAMSLKATARSKKADIIDLILRATGVDVEGAPEGASGNGAPHAEAPSQSVAAPDIAAAATEPVASNGSVPATVDVAGAPERAETAESAPVEHQAAAEPAPTTSGPRRRAPSSRRSSASTREATLFEGGGRDQEAPAHAAASKDASEAPQAAAAPPATAKGAGSGATEASGSDTRATASSAGPAPAAAGGDAAEARASEPGNAARAPSSSRDREGGRSPNQQNGAQHGGSQSQGDAGNRRSRRRRGRERGERGEVQGGPEVPWQGELVPVKGLLDLREEGYGFLRTSGYLASAKDVYVSVSQARRFALRRGDAIEGACRPAGPSEKYPALIRIDSVGGLSPDEARQRPRFEDLTPLFPDSTLHLELPGDPANLTARIVDLISPIGKGQRGMIVSPPKAGKTTVMKQIAHSIEANNPDVHLIVLLVDERPEEVTDMRRSVRGEVIASTFDRPADEHTAVAELTIERAKRLVELGRDVVIILDGITRLARAYNLAQPATGRIMSGGVDSGALYPPKRFFGAARNIEEGGSLTILATALVETGSKMDEVIFEEFKGTGNMELRLDRRLAERRIYPAIDVNASSTRHEELLFDRSQLQQVWKLRRVLNALASEGNAAAGLELLLDKIRTTRSNDEFLAEIAKAPVPTA